MKKAELVNIRDTDYIMIEGTGVPDETQEYRDAIEALHDVAFAIKFTVRKVWGFDEPVRPLESLWWMDDMQKSDRDSEGLWHWAVMIMWPEYVPRDFLEMVLKRVKKKRDLPALAKIHLGRLHEGLSMQVTHSGPHATEGSTFEASNALLKANGYRFTGKVHNIYIRDDNWNALKNDTIITRRPMVKGGKV